MRKAGARAAFVGCVLQQRYLGDFSLPCAPAARAALHAGLHAAAPG